MTRYIIAGTPAIYHDMSTHRYTGSNQRAVTYFACRIEYGYKPSVNMVDK